LRPRRNKPDADKRSETQRQAGQLAQLGRRIKVGNRPREPGTESASDRHAEDAQTNAVRDPLTDLVLATGESCLMTAWTQQAARYVLALMISSCEATGR
jgi:hypothetical protein